MTPPFDPDRCHVLRRLPDLRRGRAVHRCEACGAVIVGDEPGPQLCPARAEDANEPQYREVLLSEIECPHRGELRTAEASACGTCRRIVTVGLCDLHGDCTVTPVVVDGRRTAGCLMCADRPR